MPDFWSTLRVPQKFTNTLLPCFCPPYLSHIQSITCQFFPEDGKHSLVFWVSNVTLPQVYPGGSPISCSPVPHPHVQGFSCQFRLEGGKHSVEVFMI